MKDLRALCERDTAAALDAVSNALLCAESDDARRQAGGQSEIDDLTRDLLNQAADCLSHASKRLASRAQETSAAPQGGAVGKRPGDGIHPKGQATMCADAAKAAAARRG